MENPGLWKLKRKLEKERFVVVEEVRSAFVIVKDPVSLIRTKLEEV